ncbi:MAG: nucleoside-triphosphatase [Bacteroidota bacterium]
MSLSRIKVKQKKELIPDQELNHHIHVLTGAVQGGKTTLVTEMAEQLRKKGIRVRGFLCPGAISGGRRTDFKLVNIHTGYQLAMGSEKEKRDWIKYRRFYFNPEAFRQGTAWIKSSVSENAEILVIDEVGPMELEKMGWSEILDFLENKNNIIQLWIVRQEIVPEVIRRWKIPDQQVFTAASIESFLRKWQI